MDKRRMVAGRVGTLLVAGAFTLVACSNVELPVTSAAGTGAPAGQVAPAPADPGSAVKPSAASVAQGRRALPTIAVRAIPGKDPSYVRSKFGDPWSDAATGVADAHNGCDTRNDILKRDARPGTVKTKANGCKVTGGTWISPYTGATMTTTRQIQIDHILPLGRAWASGAKTWTAARRLAYANDPDNLISVDGSSNEKKSDKGPAAWRPAQPYQCAYAVRYIRVAVKYTLPVSASDKSALTSMLATCGR